MSTNEEVPFRFASYRLVFPAYLKKKREEEENKETEERLKRIANLEASVSNLQQQQQ